MPTGPTTNDCTATEPNRPDPAEGVQAQLGNVSALLSALGAPSPQPLSVVETAVFPAENHLDLVKLGVANSLFVALRARHAPTARHSLQVALNCSAWAAHLELSDAERDELELAALLHDLGKICTPDAILLKPDRLTATELQVIERHRQTGAGLLRDCGAPPAATLVVQYASAWFDGSREGYDLQGEQLPFGARMLAIADAFDAMTTDQVYRRALPQERAVAELFDSSGTQFDPRLVEEFCRYITGEHVRLRGILTRRWLRQLEQMDTEVGSALGGFAKDPEAMFYRKLLEAMHDAAVLVDGSLKVILWNQAAARLTGIPPASIEHKRWRAELINLRDEGGKVIDDSNCPVREAVRTGVPTPRRRLSILGRGGQRVEVEAHFVPVINRWGAPQGAALLMNDASNQVTLEEQVQSLHEKAARDPLTQVANRAEFDQALTSYINSHLERRLPCSLILCDLDHFKQVNDTFGHQAGDEVLVAFATLLRRHCRRGDLVARYGGEEFALLCADCATTTAARRADELRLELAATQFPELDGRSITSSFGVTELQAGDTPETMLRRADRALYQAKDKGRNMVVQLGSGIEQPPATNIYHRWLAWLRPARGEKVVERVLSTSVPLNIVVEKVRGFVADHEAKVETITEDHVVLQIETEKSLLARSRQFTVEMRFEESRSLARRGEGKIVRTTIHVAIRPRSSRDRRRHDTLDHAQRLLASLKSYLMAWDSDSPPESLPGADQDPDFQTGEPTS